MKYCGTTRGNQWTTGNTNLILHSKDVNLLAPSCRTAALTWKIVRSNRLILVVSQDLRSTAIACFLHQSGFTCPIRTHQLSLPSVERFADGLVRPFCWLSSQLLSILPSSINMTEKFVHALLLSDLPLRSTSPTMIVNLWAYVPRQCRGGCHGSVPR